MKELIKILIVEDSGVVRDFLFSILSGERDFYVVGTAANGLEAVKMAKQKKPDIITMDIEMPVMNGLDATRIIMEEQPVPILVVTSSYLPEEVEKTFSALEAGALAILSKPQGFRHPDHENSRAQLVQAIRSMSEVKVVKRRSRIRSYPPQSAMDSCQAERMEQEKDYRIVLMGVSTGGPQTLSKILPLLPAGYGLPLLIVQHISSGFLEGMVEWLGRSCPMPLRIAGQGEQLRSGTVYFCPADQHIGIGPDLRVELVREIPSVSIRPCISYLFRKARRIFRDQAIAILLTGMGRDGAEELLMLKEEGAMTIIQDERTCIVNGMPGEAARLGAHRYRLTPEEIAGKLIELNKTVTI